MLDLIACKLFTWNLWQFSWISVPRAPSYNQMKWLIARVRIMCEQQQHFASGTALGLLHGAKLLTFAESTCFHLNRACRLLSLSIPPKWPNSYYATLVNQRCSLRMIKPKQTLAFWLLKVIIIIIKITWCHFLPARGCWLPWMELLLDTSHSDCRGNFCRGEEGRDPLERILKSSPGLPCLPNHFSHYQQTSQVLVFRRMFVLCKWNSFNIPDDWYCIICSSWTENSIQLFSYIVLY